MKSIKIRTSVNLPESSNALRLDRETLRRLTVTELETVLGGQAPSRPNATCGCPVRTDTCIVKTA